MNGDVTIPTTMRFRPNQYAIAPRFEAAVSREHDSGGPTAAMTVAKEVVVRYTVALLLFDANKVPKPHTASLTLGFLILVLFAVH